MSVSSSSSSDIGVCFPTLGNRKGPKSPEPPKPIETPAVVEPPRVKDVVSRKGSSKRNQLVTEGHQRLRNAADLIFQHRRSLNSQGRELEDRWAELFNMAPITQKLTKGRQRPQEFRTNAEILLKDVEEELRKAEERKRAAQAPNRRENVLSSYPASIRSVARSIKTQISRITSLYKFSPPYRRRKLEEESRSEQRRPPNPPSSMTPSISRADSTRLNRKNQSTRYPPLESIRSGQPDASVSRARPTARYFDVREESVPENRPGQSSVASAYVQPQYNDPGPQLPFPGYIPSDELLRRRRSRSADRSLRPIPVEASSSYGHEPYRSTNSRPHEERNRSDRRPRSRDRYDDRHGERRRHRSRSPDSYHHSRSHRRRSSRERRDEDRRRRHGTSLSPEHHSSPRSPHSPPRSHHSSPRSHRHQNIAVEPERYPPDFIIPRSPSPRQVASRFQEDFSSYYVPDSSLR
ncbi:hypothetical protein C8J56DRAFT_1025173 [Mycena floridula]|nr:hypothetical protein C8J56DRAFT_1025173 [Mycena floridula]